MVMWDGRGVETCEINKTMLFNDELFSSGVIYDVCIML